MRRLFRFIRALWAVFLAIAGLGGTAAAQPAAAPALEAGDLGTWLDGYVPFALRSGDLAGAVVVVVKDGQVLAARGYGWADVASRRRVDPERTLFRVGSVSKLFTWTAVMQQVEAGKLDLDKDVNAWLDFRIPPLDGKPVTLRQIMTHTAGFELAGKDTITYNPPIALDAYLKRWVPRRIYAPGTTPAYSNWATALAGYIVQRVSGVPFDGYVEQRILGPLGMRFATMRQPLPGPLAGLVATPYGRASGRAERFEVVGPAPAGALSASALDMARFMIAHLEGGRGLMSPQTAALMHDGASGRVDAKALIPPLNRMALGFIGGDINGRRVIGHRGDTQFFHSALQLFVNDRVGIFVSFNSSGRDGAGGAVRDQLFADFADRYFPAPQPKSRVDAETAKQHAAMMRGHWLGSLRAESSFLGLATLAGQTEMRVTPEGELLVPSLKDAGGAPHRWDEIAPFVWQSRTGHERIAAQLAGGKPVRWGVDSLAPTGVFDRVPAARSAAWVLPMLGLSLGVLLLTGLYWPTAWLVRRRYGAAIGVQGRALLAYRVVRAACLLDIAVLGGWLVLLAAMFADLNLLSGKGDVWLVLLQVCGALVFPGAVAVAVWNAVLTWRDGRGWVRRAWSVAVVLAALMVLYTAWQFGLLALGTHY